MNGTDKSGTRPPNRVAAAGQVLRFALRYAILAPSGHNGGNSRGISRAARMSCPPACPASAQSPGTTDHLAVMRRQFDRIQRQPALIAGVGMSRVRFAYGESRTREISLSPDATDPRSDAF